MIPLYLTPAAAGMVSPAFGEDFEYLEVEGDVLADAKSLIGLFALDYSRPVCIVTDSQDLLSQLEYLDEETKHMSPQS